MRSSLENGTLTLDMNAAFANRASGTAGETLKIYALVNTFAQARRNRSAHHRGRQGARKRTIYDYAIEPNN
ncbi:MAG: GerMN domain-containing protein [Butyricicoccus sp.]